jgi:hypothetical protein
MTLKRAAIMEYEGNMSREEAEGRQDGEYFSLLEEWWGSRM